jgi:deoxyhypusine synthase
MSKQTGPQAGFDVAAHASVTGGEVRQHFDPWAYLEESQRRWNEYKTRLLVDPPARGSLRSSTMDEAAAWRDGWRAAMACAVLVAETARAPAAVDLLREQMEPPV